MHTSGDNWPLHRPQDTSLPLASSIRQIDGLQLLRAVAVSLVIWCHSGQILNDIGSHSLPDFGVFGIDIFFVISGFILSLTVLKERSQPGLRPMSEFMKRRLIRIYPIYWFFALLMLARIALAHHLTENNYLPAFLLLPSLHYPADRLIIGYSWTMMFEMFFYLLLGLILLKTIKWAIPALIILLSAFAWIGSIVDIQHPVAIVAGNPILLEFVFGAVIALLYARLGQRRVAGIFLTAAGVAASLYLRTQVLTSVANGEQMVMLDHGVFARVGTWGICAALIVGGVAFWSPSMKSALGKWWVLFGNASYSTYVVSAIVIEYATRLFFKVDTPSHSIWNRLFYATSVLVAIMAAGLVSYIVIEKPMLRKLQSKLLHKTPIRSSSHAEGSQPGNPATHPAT